MGCPPMSSWMLGFVAWVAVTPGGVVRGVEPTLWADYLQGTWPGLNQGQAKKICLNELDK